MDSPYAMATVEGTMKAYCIGSEQVVKGFALIGVEGVAPTDEAGVVASVDAALAMSDVGLLLVTDRLAANMHEKLTNWSFEHRQPLILEIPDENGPLEGRSRVLSLVMESVGLEQT